MDKIHLSKQRQGRKNEDYNVAANYINEPVFSSQGLYGITYDNSKQQKNKKNLSDQS